MRYILNSDVALRAYQKIPFCLIRKGEAIPVSLSFEEYMFLFKCDGQHDLPEDAQSSAFESKGIICKCGDEPASLSPWQKFRKFDNPIKPFMTLVITERCNYNCLHCFNASVNNDTSPELSLEQVIGILDEAERCGVLAVKVTGGEPMLHRDFLKIVDEIYKRNMWIYELMSNGSLITEPILDKLNSYDIPPQSIRISFDGLGFHDYMRCHKGAEASALAAIRMCIGKGFCVGVNVNFNRANEDTILPSLLMLDKMGVDEIWVIRTTEAPRWSEKNAGQTLGLSEYYDKSLRIASDYLKQDTQTTVFFWEYLAIYPKEKAFSSYNIKYSEATFSPNAPSCMVLRGNAVIAADGRMYPCVSMVGLFRSLNITLANVLTESLATILNDSPYSHVCHSCVRDRCENNTRCASCPFLVYCGGGCVSAALLSSGDFYGPSDAACIFFRDKWHLKISRELSGLLDLAPMDDNKDVSFFDGIELPEYPDYEIQAVLSKGIELIKRKN